MSHSRPPRIGLALGSGASRGWSHIGVLKTLIREKVEPDIICGTSIGAMIGASYLAGNIEKLERWVLDTRQRDIFRFFGIRPTESGFVDTDRFRQFLSDYVVAEDSLIEDFPKPFAAIATDVNTGREAWFTSGNAMDAVQASMALPGIFPTVMIEDRWLVDGGLVNPVPVSTCRALGAELVIGVNLNNDILGKRIRSPKESAAEDSDSFFARISKSAKDYSESIFPASKDEGPGMFDVVANSINIFQDRITRSRLAGDPADIVISPKLAHIGILDFHRAKEAIEEGEKRTMRVIDDIRSITSG